MGKKSCFVVTPIGDDNSDIRRHIDGIIDQVIEPAIGEKYEIIVAHRKFEIGSINDKIIKSIYESDLIIANLTGTNPNVMFELGIRYSFGKPAIVIAEKGTKLPFDVIDENTIFYINDPTGANELKNRICEFEEKIELERKNYGPVFKVINQIPLYNEVESGVKSGADIPSGKMMQYIIDRLDTIEKNTLLGNQRDNSSTASGSFKIAITSNSKYSIETIRNEIINIVLKYENVACNDIMDNPITFYLWGSEIHLRTAILNIEIWALQNDLEYECTKLK